MTRSPREREPVDLPPKRSEPATVESFLSLLDHHQWSIRRFVAALVPPSEADDVLQNTYLVLWREFERFQPGTNFPAWATTIACNQVYAWRKRRRRDRLVFDSELHCLMAAELANGDDIWAERAAVLAGCIARIPPRHRELVRLRYDEGHAIGEIATRMNSTADAVYRMLSRIREELRVAVATELAHRESAAGRSDGSPHFLRSRPCPSLHQSAAKRSP